MADYKRMYAILCAAASEALDLLPELPENAAGLELLQRALLEAEEVYIAGGEDASEERSDVAIRIPRFKDISRGRSPGIFNAIQSPITWDWP